MAKRILVLSPSADTVARAALQLATVPVEAPVAARRPREGSS